MLDLIKINKSFGEKNDFEVIKDITLSVKNGEFVCILGPSGCGKSILLYLLAGFLKPTSGKILIDGKSLNKPGPERMMVFQDYILFPWKTVYDNILFALENTDLNKKEKQKLVNKYISLVGLTKFKDWDIHKLSLGMQQRVAIARALVVNPKLLLMDEPLSALDTQYRNYLKKEIEKIWLKTKKTVIFVTHSVSEAVYLADKIYLLSSRPAKIRKIYEVKIKRPRKINSKECMLLRKDIEKQMYLDFQKTNKYEALNRNMERKLLR
ncbi:MAG: ABC transporter ATP-binding protein [archaeon]|nr:ABC transporter ATP-binding protein [archaeon]